MHLARVRPCCEQLEDRVCPSVVYEFDAIAQSGVAGLVRLGNGPSINDAGQVALIGGLTEGDDVFVGDGSTLRNISNLANSLETFREAVQINNTGQVVAVHRRNGIVYVDPLLGTVFEPPRYRLRIYDASSTNSFQELLRAGVPGDPYKVIFDRAVLNNSQEVAFVASDTQTTFLFNGPDTVLDSIAAPQAFLGLMTSDDGRVVARAGRDNTDPIVLFDPGFSFPIIIASFPDFTSLGSAPGISDDGSVITFSGDLSVAAAEAMGITPGPGIFASIQQGNARILRRIAGVTNNGQRDPGETYVDANQNGIFDPGEVDEGPFTGFDPFARVGVRTVGPQLSTVVYIAIGPGGAKGIYTSDLIPSDEDEAIRAGDPNKVVDNETPISVGGESVTLMDFALHDPINGKGQIAFWATTADGRQVIVRASPIRAPVILVPGIVGTFSLDGNFEYWLKHRGLLPAEMQIDPILRVYDDLIKTLENAGYVQGKDLFVANYDWRLPLAPVDPRNTDDDITNDAFDGFIDGITASSIVDADFQYGVDYLGYWLRLAVESWHNQHPDAPLEKVDIIAHSMGGLLTRSYVQSAAYAGAFDASFGPTNLPRVGNLMMLGVPNQGASKAWNPLHDNFIADGSYRLVLSKIIKAAWQIQLTGESLLGPTPDDHIEFETNPIAFINRYVPSLRGLLATYPFLDFGNGLPATVNGLPTERNNLLLDLNAGLGRAGGPSGDPNSFVDLVERVRILYAEDDSTPTTVVVHYGTDSERFGFGDIYSFKNVALASDPDPDPKVPWYLDQSVAYNGDGTVPRQSAIGQFVNDGRVQLFRFSTLFFVGNTSGDVSHTGLVSNPDVQKLILGTLSVAPDDEFIHTGDLRSSVTGLVNAWILMLDPVDGVLVDADGKRLGYTTATGPLMEIPNSVYFGDGDGIGWVFGPLKGTPQVQLSGLGQNYNVEVAGLEPTRAGEMEDNGFLAAGTLSAPAVTMLPPPNVPPQLPLLDDQRATIGRVLTFRVRATDDNQDLLTYTLDGPPGARIDPATGVFSWKAGLDQSPGTYPVTVRVTDNGSPNRSATGTFNVTLQNAVADGDLDVDFGTGGKVTTDFLSSGWESTKGLVAMQADGKLVVVGDGVYGFVVARYNPDGSLDSSFGRGGWVSYENSFEEHFFTPVDVALDSNGTILLLGEGILPGIDYTTWLLVRLSADGSLDTTFGDGGWVATQFENHLAGDGPTALALQTGGKWVVVGKRTDLNSGQQETVVTRFHANGSLDTSFGTGGVVIVLYSTSLASDVTVQSDGRIVVVGQFDAYGLLRYNQDGSPDQSFGQAGRVVGYANVIAIQTDGKILVDGSFFDSFGPGGLVLSDFGVVRYNADGSLDTGFGASGMAKAGVSGRDERATGIVVQADGKIVLAGNSDLLSIVGEGNGDVVRAGDFALASFNPDGSLDADFGDGGVVRTDLGSADDSVGGVVVQAGGRIVLTGQTSRWRSATDFALAGYTSGGLLDTEFGARGIIITDFTASGQESVSAVTRQPDGKLVVAGTTLGSPGLGNSTNNFALARYNPDGSLDTRFGQNGRVITDLAQVRGGRAAGVAVQNDGKIIVVGTGSRGLRPGTYPSIVLVRYQPDGRLDRSFGDGGKVFLDELVLGIKVADVTGLVIQSDGKIAVAFTALTFNSNNNYREEHEFAVLRFNRDGRLDVDFGYGGLAITDFASDPLIDGWDNFGSEAAALDVALQSDGKIIVAGKVFNSFGFSYDFALARFNLDGSLDTGFDENGMVITDLWFITYPSPKDLPSSLAVLPNGKILVAGTTGDDFSLIRYNPDGSRDQGFGESGVAITSPPAGIASVAAVSIQADSSIIVAGTSGDDLALLRFDSKGSRDTSWGDDGMLSVNLGSNEETVANLLIQPDGAIIVAGTSRSSVTRRDFTLVRLWGTETAPASRVNALPASQDSAVIALSWSRTDAGSGNVFYDLYVSDNGGAFNRFLQGTQVTSGTFTGVYGHTYGFYSVATDNVGNRQATPTTAQATVAILDFKNQVSIAGGIVRVGGTNAVDNIILAPTADGTKLQVTINGKIKSSNVLLSKITQIRIFGRNGDDAITISNLAKPFYIEGGVGTDRAVINGRAMADTFVLAAAAVTVNSKAISLNSLEHLVVNGNDGNDVLIVQAVPGFTVSLNGGAGLDRVQGPNATNTWSSTGTTSGNLNGATRFSGVEKLTGGSAADTLIGPNQNNSWNITGNNAGKVNTLMFSGIENLTGNAKNDSFALANGKGTTGRIDGGAGRNALNYAASTTAVNVDLEAGTASNIGGGIGNIRDVLGGVAGDVLMGDALENFLSGNGGNDTIDGRGGNNVLMGAAGNDTLTGGGSRDLVFGGAGADNLNSGAGEDILFSGTTTFDTNRAAIESLFAYWKRQDLAYSTRVAKLRAGTTGVAAIPKLNSTTVLADSSIDTLLGDADLDWYFAKLLDPAKDLVNGLELGEKMN